MLARGFDGVEHVLNAAIAIAPNPSPTTSRIAVPTP